MISHVELSDGTLRREYPPQQGVPFYSDWLRALEHRKAAFDAPSLKGGIDAKTGLPKRQILTLNRYQEQACELFSDGTVGILCLCCATPTQQLLMSRITVGALVQLRVITPLDAVGTDGVSEVSRWRQRVVARAGLGCGSCAALYADEVAEVAAENEQRRLYVDALRRVYVKRGDIDSAGKVADAKVLTAFLDILRDQHLITLYQLSEAQEATL